MARRALNVAVVGATGAVGREILSILESRELPLAALEVFASPQSEGEELSFNGRSLRTHLVNVEALEEIDVVLMAVPEAVSLELTPLAVQAGAVVIDCSAAYREAPDVPLVVPEVNLEALAGFRTRRIVASPAATTVGLAAALRPIQLAAGIRRLVATSYESTSGDGRRGMEVLNQEVLRLYRRMHLEAGEEELASDEYDSPYPHQIAFNALPHVGGFLADGMSRGEAALIGETRRVLGAPDLRISSTCVRGPLFACVAVSVNVETERALSAEEARSLLSSAPGLELEDEPALNIYPMPFPHAGSDEVFVGRVRRDPSLEHGLNFWVVLDNLRKGSALNMVQILEGLSEMPLRAS